MKKVLKKVAPSSFGACFGVSLVNVLRYPARQDVVSLLLGFAVNFIAVTFVLTLLFWLWDKVKGTK